MTIDGRPVTNSAITCQWMIYLPLREIEGRNGDALYAVTGYY